MKGLTSGLIHPQACSASCPGPFSQSLWTRIPLLLVLLGPSSLGTAQTVGPVLIAEFPSCSCHQRSSTKNAVTVSTVRQSIQMWGEDLGSKTSCFKEELRSLPYEVCIEKESLAGQDQGGYLVRLSARWRGRMGFSEGGCQREERMGLD